MFPRKLLVLGLFLFCLCCTGCTSKQASPLLHEQATHATPIQSEKSEGPRRYIADLLRTQAQSPRDHQPIALDDTWVTEAVKRYTGSGFRLEPGNNPPWIAREVSEDVARYNRLRVQMRANGGELLALRWEGELLPRMETHPGMTLPIYPDGQSHGYTFVLDNATPVPWLGHVTGIRLDLSDAPSEIVVEEIAWGYEPPEGPPRLMVGNTTHEAVWGTQAPWQVVVPLDARFVSSLALLPPPEGETPGADGALFTVSLERSGEAPIVLAEEEIVHASSSWTNVVADLSAYSGEEVLIRMQVRSGESTTSDYAYWGAPRIAESLPDCTPVVLISCDTLRADHLSLYGYERETSPWLDAFASEAVTFEQAIVQESWTPTSHMTMLTGLYPKNHHLSHAANLPESIVTLPERLQAAGYYTAGIVGHSWWLMPWRGFSHGFDYYSVPSPDPLGFRNVFDTHSEALRILDVAEAPNFFLFLHNYDIHSRIEREAGPLPYFPPTPEWVHFARDLEKPQRFASPSAEQPKGTDFLVAANYRKLEISQEERDYMVALYDDSIRAVDLAIQQLFEALKERRLYDRALIIVTSDHGEAFGEHGEYLHEQTYEHTIRVPLLVKFPGAQYGGTRYDGLVELTDIAPTVVDVLGLAPGPKMDGKSLRALLDGGEGRQYAFTNNRLYDRQSARGARWKLHHKGKESKWEFYDLQSDPDEAKDLYAEKPPALEEVDAVFSDFFSPAEGGWHFLLRGQGQRGDLKLYLKGEAILRDTSMRLAEHWEGNYDTFVLEENGSSLRASLEKGPVDVDELFVRPEGKSQRVLMRAESSSPVQVYYGGKVSEATKHSMVLEPEEGQLARRPIPSTTPSEHLELYVWYEAPHLLTEAAGIMSDEQREAIKALGYVGVE